MRACVRLCIRVYTGLKGAKNFQETKGLHAFKAPKRKIITQVGKKGTRMGVVVVVQRGGRGVARE